MMYKVNENGTRMYIVDGKILTFDIVEVRPTYTLGKCHENGKTAFLEPDGSIQFLNERRIIPEQFRDMSPNWDMKPHGTRYYFTGRK